MEGLLCIILAAGEGKRMVSSVPKALHKVCGASLLEHALEKARACKPEKIVVVIGYGAEQMKEALKGKEVEIVEQRPLCGSGHALTFCKEYIKEAKHTLILYVDTPLLSKESIFSLVKEHIKKRTSCTIAIACLQNPSGYGRVIMDGKHPKAIVEEADCTASQRKSKIVNVGVYCVECNALLFALSHLKKSKNGEIYLTDIVSVLYEAGYKTGYVKVAEEEALGVNDREALSLAEKRMRQNILRNLMHSGVTILDPSSTFIDASVKIGKDTIIYPFTMIYGESEIGRECVIGPNACLVNTKVEENVTIFASYITSSKIMSGAQIGPFAHIRPETIVGKGVRVGNFVELKNSTIMDNTRVAHLSYIGDASVGENVNIGAGTITCNFDGKKKHRTTIESGAFIGSNTSLVAPLKIGKRAIIGAGSTITHDVPDDALGIARERQRNILNWAKRRR